MVLQRQVPARSASKADDAAGQGKADTGRDNAFTAALSKEQRSAVAERERAEVKTRAGNAEDSVETEDRDESGAVQSDEILKLLSALKSSAAYSDEPLTVAAPDELAAGQVSLDEPLSEAAEPDEAIATDAVATDAVARPDVGAVNVAAAAALEPDARPAAVTPQAAEPQVAAAVASRTIQPETGIGAGQAVPAPAALASVASEAGAAQNALQRAKAQSTNGAAAETKDPSAVKEAMRVLGLSADAEAPAPAAARPSLRSRNSEAGNRQGEAAERMAENDANAKSPKVEVIESRRFMPAQSLSANAQMLTRSLADAGSAALAAQRTAPAQAAGLAGQPQSGQMLHTLKLQLNPVSLGSVTAVLKLTGEELSVEIKVETAEAYRKLKDDTQSIVKTLRAQGYGVEQITVQHVAGADRSTGQAPQSGFQGSQGNPQGQGAGDAQSSGRESGGNSAGRRASNEQEGQGREQNPYAGAGRTDGVYL